MTAIGALLAHLRRPEVSEVHLVSGRRPAAIVDGEPTFISDETLTSDDVVRLLFTAGGSRYVDGLGPRPAQWRTRVEGVGAVGVTAISTGPVIEARFVLRDSASIAPGSTGGPSSERAARARSSVPPAVLDGEPRRRSSQPAPAASVASTGSAVRTSPPPPPSLEAWSTRATHPRMDRSALYGDTDRPRDSAPVTVAEATPRSLAKMVELDLPPSFPSPPPPVGPSAGAAFATTLPNLRVGGLAESGPLAELLARARELGASDVHLVPGRRATLRVAGRLVQREPALDATTLATRILGYAPRRATERVLQGHAATFALEEPTLGRFRVHVVPSRGGVSASIRPIPRATPSLLALGIDAVVTPALVRGARFILVGSPLGNGRSTTIAAILDRLSAARASSIVTVEDPIEHVLSVRRALVRQIEVGTHAVDRAAALASALDDAPDVLALGDLTDASSVRAGLRAVLRGALVLASFPTTRPALAAELAVARLPDSERRRARSILASARAVVLAQKLVQPREGEAGPLGVAIEAIEAIDLAPEALELARTSSSSIPPGPVTGPPLRPSIRLPASTGLLDRVFKKGG